MSLAALRILVSPLSRFLLWLGPFQEKGSRAEWLMLAIDGLACLGALALSLAALWAATRGRNQGTDAPGMAVSR